MRTTTSPEITYHQDKMWQPSDFSDHLTTLLPLIQNGGGTGLERQFMSVLSHEIRRHIPDYQKDFYRAEKAIDKGVGNCLAEAEVVMGIGQALELPMYMLWDGRHATTLWAGKTALWCVEAQNPAKLGEFPQQIDQQGNTRAHQLTGRNIIEEAEGRAFINRSGWWLNEQLDWTAITGELGDARAPYVSSTLMLPSTEAIQFITALGDRNRYTAKKPELLKKLGSQIDRYLPQLTPAYTNSSESSDA